MGLRGPQPTPTAVLAARGSWRAMLREDKNIKPSKPKAPDWLDAAAKKLFKKYTSKLSNVLTKNDANVLALLCQAEIDYTNYRKNPIGDIPLKVWAKNEKDLHDRYFRLLREFGLTPASRGTIPQMEKPKEKGNELDDLI